MITILAAATALALVQQTDTTIPVRSGARLEVNNFGGSIVVGTWSRSAVRVQAEHSSRDRIQVSASEAVVSVKSTGKYGPSRVMDYAVTVPPWMALALSGVYTDITVEGSQGEITAETVQGEVRVSGGSGFVSLRSVNGEVTLEKARGRINLNTVNEGITLREASGDVSAETVNGDVTLERIESGNVEANTVNGEISYDGTIKESGRYRFATHDGDLKIAIPENTSVTVSVSTFDGEFSSCFPVQLQSKTKHRFSFTIGSGSARLELESFNGDINICRPGRRPKEDR
jgi:putative adhesin